MKMSDQINLILILIVIESAHDWHFCFLSIYMEIHSCTMIVNHLNSSVLGFHNVVMTNPHFLCIGLETNIILFRCADLRPAGRSPPRSSIL